MSGGSFNYLCWKEADDLFQHRDDIKGMAEELEVNGHKAAAQATEEVLVIMENYWRIITARTTALEDVWHAVEWWRSGDWGKEDVDRVVGEWEKSFGTKEK